MGADAITHAPTSQSLFRCWPILLQKWVEQLVEP